LFLAILDLLEISLDGIKLNLWAVLAIAKSVYLFRDKES
jgi:hypothetical protein